MINKSQIKSAVSQIGHNSIKQLYWDYCKHREQMRELSTHKHAPFATFVRTENVNLRKNLDYPGRISDRERLEAAVAWILCAQKASHDDGVSLGYFPLATDGGWRPSYPETTGYLITSLLRYAARYNQAEVRRAADAMARWEIDIQMASGAVQGGPVVPAEKQTPAAFNTGMVLDGWCSAYETTQDPIFLEAGVRAAQFLANDLDPDGYFQTNGDFVTSGEIKTYTCLCCWAMYRIGAITQEKSFKNAAILGTEAALKQQTGHGWIQHNCLSNSQIPLTHTIGYALQGILEVGILAERDDFVAAAEKGLRGAIRSMEDNGYLAGRLDAGWRPAENFVCLTGSCQLAIVAYRLATLFGKQDLAEPARRLLRFVKATQCLESDDPGLVGGIAGSFPVMGKYMSAGFPNWATKYFIDAVMLLEDN